MGAQPVAPTSPAPTDSDDDVVTAPDDPIDTMDDDGLDDTYIEDEPAPVYVTPPAPVAPAPPAPLYPQGSLDDDEYINSEGLLAYSDPGATFEAPLASTLVGTPAPADTASIAYLWWSDANSGNNNFSTPGVCDFGQDAYGNCLPNPDPNDW